MKTPRLLLLVLCVALFAPAVHAADPSGDAAETPVAIELHRGVNLSHWLAQAKRYRHDPHYHTPEHFRLIRALGLDHVRLSIDPEPLTAADGALDAEHAQRIDAAVDMILDAGLNVVIDVHPEDPFKLKLAASEQAVADFAAFWSKLAGRYADRDPKRVCFELINEPRVEDAGRWNRIQHRLHAAVRDAAPRHTVVLTAHKWSSADLVPQIEPVDDANVLYTFHYYEPFHFTHQGSTWTTDWLRQMRGLPYPATPQNVEPVLGAIPDGEPRNNARWYGEQGWDRAKLAATIDVATAWAADHGVKLYLGEFGVLRTHAPRDSRLRWHEDVRQIAEQRRMPWCLWDFADVFGLATREGAAITPDPQIIEALGLTMPR